MKIVAWNMAHRIDSWSRLAELEADAALLSEARVPSDYPDLVVGGERTHGMDGFDRPWAAAITARHPLEPIIDARATRYGRPLSVPFASSRPGTWEAALLSPPDDDPITLVSLYGLMDEKSDASVHRSLSELSGLFEDERYSRLLVLGGDLNTWTGWGEGSAHLARDTNVLDRFAAHGLVDALDRMRDEGSLEECPCSLGEGCRHVRTRVDPRSPHIPYQVDYLFVSKAMAERLTSCVALDRDTFPTPSDHFPIVATFDETVATG
jgi:hypothetical protein